MAVYRVEGKRYPFDHDQVLYVAAADPEQARGVAARMGSTANNVREVSASEVPPDTELIRAPEPAGGHATPARPQKVELADSDLFRRPVRTIAFGLGMGLFIGWASIMVISALLAVLFGAGFSLFR